MPNSNEPYSNGGESQEALNSLLVGSLDEVATNHLAENLESDEGLRVRLEELSGLTTWSYEMKQLGNVSKPPSAALTRAIQALLMDGAKLINQAVALIDVEIDSDNIVLIRPLGSGAMGVVYEGYDKHLGRPVAVKLLSSHWKDNPAAKERLLREAQAAAQLQHENVVAIHSIHPIGDRPYIVQQFVAGESLQKRVNRLGRLPLEEVQSLAVQLAKGLAAAHRCGLVHRDLKPDNILIENETGIVRIADFGLVKRQGSEQMTQEGVIAGTPAYMSPEQTRGETLDARSDLFSLGLVLYRAASGKQPFEGDDPYVLMDQIRTGIPISLKLLTPELPATWVAAVEKLMAKERDDRFASASQFLDVVQPKTVHSVESPGTTIRPRQLSHKIIFAGVIAALSFGLGAFALWNPNSLPLSSRSTIPSIVKESKRELVEPVSFRMSDDSRRFLKLEEAVVAAKDGATILVSGQGTVDMDSIRLNGKSLKIIALPDSRPTLRATPLPSGVKEPFISTESELLLSGLTIESSRSASGTFELPAQTILQNKGGKLTIDGCKIEATSKSVCVASVGGTVHINNSIIGAKEGIIFGSIHPGVSLKVQNSYLDSIDCFEFITGDGQVGDSQLANQVDGDIVLEQVSISSTCAFRFGLYRTPSRLIRITLVRSILDCESVIALFTKMPNRFELSTPDGLIKNMDELIQWDEDRCIYKSDIQFLSSFATKRQGKKSQRLFRTWDEWSAHWNLSPKTSIQSNIRRTRGASHSIFDLENLPEDYQECGADMDKIPNR